MTQYYTAIIEEIHQDIGYNLFTKKILKQGVVTYFTIGTVMDDKGNFIDGFFILKYFYGCPKKLSKIKKGSKIEILARELKTNQKLINYNTVIVDVLS